MKKVLVTGGTVFVSKRIAEHFVANGDEVYVLNRNHRQQPDGVKLIEADRHQLGDQLRSYHFDVVIDANSYTQEDMRDLLDAVEDYKDYIFISSSAVYPETLLQPFKEEQEVGENKYWGAYGTNKIMAEQELLQRVPNAYILRPPYLYGPENNVYREAFVFECANQNRKFYLPEKGQMKLQFFHIDDLCQCIDAILEKHPKEHIFNVGNEDMVTIKDWVELSYRVAGKCPEYVEVSSKIEPRNYFSFYRYEYELDVTKQKEILNETIPLEKGLKECYLWYQEHKDAVNTKNYFSYIDENLA